MSWSPAKIPDLTGRTTLVTGPTLGGLGHRTALHLAQAGARVILAGRRPERLGDTAAAIRADVPDASLDELVVDLADLTSIRRGAEAAGEFGPIDLLVNMPGSWPRPSG